MSQTLTPAHVEVLAGVRLFERLDRVALARLAACADPLRFGAGETVWEQGDAADGLYVVVEGTFDVVANDPTSGREGQIGASSRGDVLGELALLFDEPRTATVRARTDGELLRVEKERFLQLMRSDPAVGVAIAATLGRRLRDRDHARLADRAFAGRVVAQALAELPDDALEQVLQASLLPDTSLDALEAIFGADAPAIHAALWSLGESDGDALAAPVQRELRTLLARRIGEQGVASTAEALAMRLLDADRVEDALLLAQTHAARSTFLAVLTRALRTSATLPQGRLDYWLSHVAEHEALASPELALARAEWQERRSALAPESPMRAARSGWRARLGVALSAVCVVLGALVVGSSQVAAFGLFLAAAAILWITEIAPASAVALGLMTAWVLSGLASPTEAAAGFATPDWLFVLSVFGIAAAVSRSGLIFRAGLLLVRRLPAGLFGQAGTLMLTGVLLTPLLPTATGRAAITASLARSVTESLRIRDRQPAAAVLGLAAWIGAGPLLFTFLNGSSICLLAWGLMPDASREAFGWVTWLLAAMPFSAIVAATSLCVLFVVLRPRAMEVADRERVDVQLTVLGRPSRRELAMLAVLVATVGGLIAAPALHVNMGVVAVLGLIVSVATGAFDRQALRELDWDYLIFYGVALSLVRLGTTLGVDGMVGDAVRSAPIGPGMNRLALVVLIALLTIVVRMALGTDQSVLLLCLALIPSARALGLDPWVVIITVLAAAGVWLIPSQMPSYLAAYSASEGRLYSPSQSRRAALGFAAALLVGLAVSVPYWHLLGLL